MKAIELIGLEKSYRVNVKALCDLNLSVEKGTLFGFVGPNGAGKSTTIKILAGLAKKDKGEVRLFGNEISSTAYEYKRDVGFVLETPYYIDKLTSREYLNFAAAMYGIPPKEAAARVDELLAFLDLEEKKKEMIESFSAGMKKKVSLAAAVIHQPRLLILDEPLEGIDPTSAKQIKDMLRRIVNKGESVFMSSHNLDTVEKLCDEVAIINKGKLVFQSRTEDIRKKIKDEVSQETYQSLEEIFIDVVSKDGEQKEKKKLSWL